MVWFRILLWLYYLLGEVQKWEKYLSEFLICNTIKNPSLHCFNISNLYIKQISPKFLFLTNLMSCIHKYRQNEFWNHQSLSRKFLIQDFLNQVHTNQWVLESIKLINQTSHLPNQLFPINFLFKVVLNRNRGNW